MLGFFFLPDCLSCFFFLFSFFSGLFVFCFCLLFIYVLSVFLADCFLVVFLLAIFVCFYFIFWPCFFLFSVVLLHCVFWLKSNMLVSRISPVLVIIRLDGFNLCNLCVFCGKCLSKDVTEIFSKIALKIVNHPCMYKL